MRTFTMYRRAVPTDTHDENQRNAPDQAQFEGVVWTDGTCAIRWLTAKPATAVWASFDDMLAIHGHPEYGSELVWTARADEYTCPCCDKPGTVKTANVDYSEWECDCSCHPDEEEDAN